MIPTIDFSNLAVLGGFIAIVKGIWGLICSSSAWLKNAFVIAVSSSRIWATAFFLTVVISVVALLTQLSTRALGLIETWLFSQVVQLSAFDFEFGVINQFFNFTNFFNIVNWCIAFTFSVLALEKTAALINQGISKFMLIFGAWKT